MEAIALGQALQVFALIRQRAPAAVHVEPGVNPAAQPPGAVRRKQTLFGQKRDGQRPEQLLQRIEADFGHGVKQTFAHEQAVGCQHVRVGMEFEVLAENVDGHDDAGQARWADRVWSA